MFLAHGENTIIAALMLSLLVLTLTVIGTFAQAFLRLNRRGSELETQRQWGRRLVDASFDGMLIHRAGTVLQMNSALVRMLGCREREIIGNQFANFAIPEQVAAFRTELEAPRPLLTEFTLLRSDKTEIAVEISSHTIEHERAPATVTAIRDISQRRADAARIFQLMHHDLLTGLPNRKLFVDLLTAQITQNEAEGGTTALFFIDIDQLKAVNDQIGRNSGDQLLKQVAARIRASLHPGDILSRISGDKFALMMSSPAAAARAIILAKQLETQFKEPFVIDGQLLKASISLGIALYPDHAADANGLMKSSDYALKKASAAGGGFAHLFTAQDATELRAPAARDTMHVGLTETQRLAQDLRSAVANNEISLVYQPIFRASDQALIGHEALARWNHKTDGLIGPVVFIPLAEQAGLIHEIGAHVLENACAEAVLRTPGLKIAVNLSPLQFRDPDLPARITAILRKTSLDPALLELEVTESLLIENAAAASQALQALRDIGVSVALDDFGTGYSSLSYLCDYPFARLKIDKRFIQALGTDANADAIVVAILALANNLKLDVTAEGVETEVQLDFLKKAGCSMVQGYLLGRPNARALTPPPAKLRPPPPFVPAVAVVPSQAAGPPPVPQKRVPSRA